MPNMLITECAHHRPDEWLREPVLRESVRQAVHDWVLFPHKGYRAVVNTSVHQRHKRQVHGFIVYTDSICPRASELLLGGYVRPEPSQTAQPILRELEVMLHDEDELDFLHRPTQYAYDFARQIIGASYTHYVGSAPVATLAPDGEGGIVAEWKDGRRTVRLIVSANQEGKSYVYSRGPSRSLVDYSVTGLMLSQQLSSIFGD